jgi:integrase
VFARPDGSMYPRDVATEHVLRRAMGCAGIVVGWEHRCRRHHCGFRELRADAAPSRCPRCNFALWAKPIPRHVRFHDLRHTTATLLLKEGVPLATVQKILRHSDPELTAETYGHLDLKDMRRGLDRLTFEDGSRSAISGYELALTPESAALGAPVLRNRPGIHVWRP